MMMMVKPWVSREGYKFALPSPSISLASSDGSNFGTSVALQNNSPYSVGSTELELKTETHRVTGHSCLEMAVWEQAKGNEEEEKKKK